MNKATIIIVDDEEVLLRNIVDYMEDYAIKTCSHPSRALDELENRSYDILIADYKMPGMTGLELLRTAKKLSAYTYGILFTAYADKTMLQHALNEGIVSRLIEKPLKLKEFKETVDEAITVCQGNHKTKQKLHRYETLVKVLSCEDEQIIGLEQGLKAVFSQVQSAAQHPVNVMLTGETGTGKEVIAHLIHRLSPRMKECFIAVNCANLSDNLIESELFGHEKGSFTGANTSKVGKIELADKGTLFLDEIGELKLEHQARLLRVIQDKKVEPLGSNQSREIDFRLIVATNKDLEKAIEEKTFREDLYYRINAFPIRMPALRERKEDIGALVTFYLAKFCWEMKLNVYTMEKSILPAFEKYTWPGNIRQLMNAVERALMIAEQRAEENPEAGEQLTLDDFAFLFRKRGKESTNLQTHVDALSGLVIAGELDIDDIEGAVLTAILKKFDGNKNRAATQTGINRGKFNRNAEKNKNKSQESE